jgi:two-component system, NarL family, invasion response regulator UvrY
VIRVVIADDHTLIRDGFRKLIDREEGLVFVGEAQNASQLTALLGSRSVDVVVLDISLPDRNGLEVLQELREKFAPRVLVLSMHPENRYALRSIKNGADGYITKDRAPEELARAIRRVYSGKKYITPALAEELARSVESGSAADPHEKLSNREYQVLLKIGRGQSIREIAQDLFLSVNTVHTYRRRIMEKTGLGSTRELIRYTVNRGLVEREEK